MLQVIITFSQVGDIFDFAPSRETLETRNMRVSFSTFIMNNRAFISFKYFEYKISTLTTCYMAVYWSLKCSLFL